MYIYTCIHIYICRKLIVLNYFVLMVVVITEVLIEN